MKHTLWIDSSASVSGDRFVAALIGLGAPEQETMQAIQSAVEELGMLDAHLHIEFLPVGTLAHRLYLVPLKKQEPLSLKDALTYLECTLARTKIEGPYAEFAHRAYSILYATEVHNDTAAPVFPQQCACLPIIGIAHTPYKHKVPYQPMLENVNDDTFYSQVSPQYSVGMQTLHMFSCIFVLFYLDRVLEPEITVLPTWKYGSESGGTHVRTRSNLSIVTIGGSDASQSISDDHCKARI